MKNFSVKYIREIRKALKDDAAGNKCCTMTDLDLACDMLDELAAKSNWINSKETKNLVEAGAVWRDHLLKVMAERDALREEVKKLKEEKKKIS